ncbi:PRK06851 family protein [Proteinivorax hydrogeniformans]|uniref:PRK06851 family protein n=1 Tax=Proteinivorax hydrogeniformans TaxID=1826727 RepID=A0AAU8HVU2_9FIRM
MNRKIKNVFPGGNTSEGFYSFYEEVLSKLDRLFILKGGPGTGKSSLIKKVAKHFLERGQSITFLHCSSDTESVDGVIINELSLGVVDGTAPHVVDPTLPGIKDEIINLGEFWDRNLLLEDKEEITRLKQNIKTYFSTAYKELKYATIAQNKMKKIYVPHIDNAKVEEIKDKLISMTLKDKESSKKKGRLSQSFAGAITPRGIVSFAGELTDNLSTRVLLLGKPGTNKSTIMESLADKATSLGYDVEAYHCALNPHKLDLVIIPQKQIAFVDASPPHKFVSKSSNDILVDMFALTVPKEIAQQNQKQILNLQRQVDKHILKATSNIKNAKENHAKMENFYIKAMDFDKMQEVFERIIHGETN